MSFNLCENALTCVDMGCFSLLCFQPVPANATRALPLLMAVKDCVTVTPGHVDQHNTWTHLILQSTLALHVVKVRHGI